LKFEIGPLDGVVPIKPYPTLSESQCRKRLEIMYRTLARAVIARGTEHLAAKVAYFRQYQESQIAKALIGKWNEDHKSARHLAARQQPSLYPWGKNITPENYLRSIQRKEERFKTKVITSEYRLNEAIKRFCDRIEFVRQGMAWLSMRDRAAQNLAELNREQTEKSIDFTSSDICDDVTFLDFEKARSHREKSGWKVELLKPSSRLLADGVEFAESVHIVAKLVDPNYMSDAIEHILLGASSDDVTELIPLVFDVENFLRHRREVTERFFVTHMFPKSDPSENDESYSQTMKGSRWPTPHLIPPKTHFPSNSPRRSSVMFRPTGAMIKDGKGTESLIEQDLGAHNTPQYRQALLHAEAGQSFMITGPTGSGKSTMVPGLVSRFLSKGQSVKIIANLGTREMIIHELQKREANIGRDVARITWKIEEKSLTIEPRQTIKRPDNIEHEKIVAAYHNSPEIQGDVLIVDDSTNIPFHAAFATKYDQVIIIGDSAQYVSDKSTYEVAAISELPRVCLRVNHRAANCDTMIWSNIFTYDCSVAYRRVGRPTSQLQYVPLARITKGVVETEAVAVSKAVRKALQTNETLGVTAFSRKQLQSILELLDAEDLHRLAFAGLPNEIMGKEADVVFVSLGIALTQKDRLPLTSEGLEGRHAIGAMNIALSRARNQNVIFSSVLPSDIDLRVASDSQVLVLSVLETFNHLRKRYVRPQ